MKFWNFALAGILLILSNSANAVLVSRLDGLAYYDTEANLTWLADANYAKTSGYDVDGRMNWVDANAWAAGLSMTGVTGWRLPESNICSGDYCTGSEMGTLYYNVLGNSGFLKNTGPFVNVQTSFYWSSTDNYPYLSGYTWSFKMSNGNQTGNAKTNSHYAWAVHDGDVSAVPVPAAVWLFGSGLIGLVGFARHK